MSIEEHLLADAKSFAEEVKDLDDRKLLVDVLTRLGIQPSSVASPANLGPAATAAGPERATPCGPSVRR
jgi:hypothetical protein